MGTNYYVVRTRPTIQGPVQPAGHTALYIRQNWYGWQQCDDFKDKAEEEDE